MNTIQVVARNEYKNIRCQFDLIVRAPLFSLNAISIGENAFQVTSNQFKENNNLGKTVILNPRELLV